MLGFAGVLDEPVKRILLETNIYVAWLNEGEHEELVMRWPRSIAEREGGPQHDTCAR